MPESPLIAAGAQVQPVSAAPLHVNRMLTGLWTQRNLLRDAATPYLMEKFYLATRFDSLVGGQNMELTPKMTLKRRPGFSMYNAAVTVPIQRFYLFRTVSQQGIGSANISTVYASNTTHPLPRHICIVTCSGTVPTLPTGTHVTFGGLTNFTALNGVTAPLTQPSNVNGLKQFVIAWYGASQPTTPDTGTVTWIASPLPTANNRVLGDSATGVYDITGPSTFQLLFSKTAGAAKTRFLGVGNVCYMSDGIDQMQYVVPYKIWMPSTIYNAGDTILDPNGNVEVVEQLLTATISSVQTLHKLTLPPSGYTVYVAVTFTSNVSWPSGTMLTFSGLTGATWLNGQTLGILDPEVWGSGLPNTITVPASPGASYPYGPTADTGTATSTTGYATGESGTSPPIWPAVGGTVTDGNLVWQNFGKPVYGWGANVPTQAPIVTPTTGNRQWTPNTTIPYLYSILDPNNNVEVALTVSKISGNAPPNWSTTVPSFTSAGGTTSDGGVLWQNCGQAQSWAPSTAYQTFQSLHDSNGNLQIVTNGGGSGSSSGSSAPATWGSTVGATTTDGTLTWTCIGSGAVLLTDTVEYAYSWHYITGQVTTASPISVLNANGAVLGPANNTYATLVGPTNGDPGMDQIWIWRTAQGGSSLLLLAKVPNPSPGTATTWHYTDGSPDSSLDPQTPAPINSINNPPPQYFVPMAYHLGRVCGAVGSILYYSSGPDTITGNGNESFAPLNYFQLPSLIVAEWSTAIGLIVFRVDGISVMLGKGEDSDPFHVLNIFDAVGLGGADAWTTRGNVVSMMTKTGKLVALSTAQIVAAIEGELSQSLDEAEVGFPIGDLLDNFTAASSFVVWHEGESEDSRLWVCDGISQWYNMLNLVQPEQATPWSPVGVTAGGLTAIGSIETAPGVQSLLLGTPTGPIWQRDLTTNADNGTPYACSSAGGNIVLAQPGTQAGFQYITTEEMPFAGATPVAVGVLFDEIQGNFVTLRNSSNDPPNQPASQSILAKRSWGSQGPDTVQVCRHMQWEMSWPAENFPTELLTYTIYGRLPEKARK